MSLFRVHGPSLTCSLYWQPEEIRHANFATEIRAGLTTFATMAYIIAVNVCTSGSKMTSSLFCSAF